MLNVTINMLMEDFEYIKNELLMAEQNTFVSNREGVVIDKEKIEMANAQINHVLSKLGC